MKTLQLCPLNPTGPGFRPWAPLTNPFSKSWSCRCSWGLFPQTSNLGDFLLYGTDVRSGPSSMTIDERATCSSGSTALERASDMAPTPYLKTDSSSMLDQYQGLVPKSVKRHIVDMLAGKNCRRATVGKLRPKPFPQTPPMTLPSSFGSIMSYFSFPLSSNTNFPIHNKNHIFDLVITSSDSLHLSVYEPLLRYSSDHFTIFTKLSLHCTSLPPIFHSFCRLHSTDIDSFTSNLQSSRLITNPPTYLGFLLISYNTTLSSIFDKHAPIISKFNPWFTHSTLSGLLSVVLKLTVNELILLFPGHLSRLYATATIN